MHERAPRYAYANPDRRLLLLVHILQVGAFAAPDQFHWASTGLPKTRSGKIMRRILRKVNF